MRGRRGKHLGGAWVLLLLLSGLGGGCSGSSLIKIKVPSCHYPQEQHTSIELSGITYHTQRMAI